VIIVSGLAILGAVTNSQREKQPKIAENQTCACCDRIMAPDVAALHEPAGGASRLIVLDAKYRIEKGLNDALSSIHTYRDALVQEAQSGAVTGVVTAAYLLTPHLPVLGDGYRDTPMPSRLFHPAYRAGFRFGAVTLRPGMTVPDIAAALRQIVADATAPGTF
jgi:hypothetical protein